MMHQMKHSHQELLQREQGLTKLLEDADRNLPISFCDFSSSNAGVHSVEDFSHFTADSVRLKALVTGMTISKTPQVEATEQRKCECDLQ